MAKLKSDKYRVSRREFLRGMRWAPVLFLPAPIRGSSLRPPFSFDERKTSFPFADARLTPHYPSKSPLDDVLRLVTPGADEFLTEKYAFEIGRLLDEWSRGLRTNAPALDVVGRFLDPLIEGGLLGSAPERIVRSGNGISIVRRQFGVESQTQRRRAEHPAEMARPAAMIFSTKSRLTLIVSRRSRPASLKLFILRKLLARLRRFAPTFVTTSSRR